MRIDSRVEPLVRETLAAAIARDHDRARAATQALVDTGDQAFASGVALCCAVDTFVLCDVCEGPPPAEGIESLAESFAAMEAWSGIDQPTARTFLTALTHDREPQSVLAPDLAVSAAFAMGAWLLSAFWPDDTQWESALDEALIAIEVDCTL